MRKIKWINLLLLMLLIACGKAENKNSNEGDPDEKDPIDSLIGEVLPDWQEGYLDIHAINTGRGESTFFILPDGTTMMVDASSSLISPNNEFPPPPRKPNDNISSGKAISNYIKHFLPSDNKRLNYILISHFHPDHMGGESSSMPLGPDGNFTKNGVTEIGVEIPFDLLMDRGYPDYDYPWDRKPTALISNYIKFFNWAKDAHNASAEQFEAGRNDQIILKKNASKYKDFEIRNLAVNGEVWTGNGIESTSRLPEDSIELNAAEPNENIFSNVFQLSYGKFDYFTGGDIQYNGRTQHPWKDIEAPIAEVVSQVDVMKASHHGTSNTNSSTLLNKLKPEVVLCHPWRDVHPNPETVQRFYDANNSCKIFLTNLDPSNREKLGANAAKLRSTNGHIVVRVAPGGEEYSVYSLDDSNEKYLIKQVFGPFKSK